MSHVFQKSSKCTNDDCSWSLTNVRNRAGVARRCFKRKGSRVNYIESSLYKKGFKGLRTVVSAGHVRPRCHNVSVQLLDRKEGGRRKTGRQMSRSRDARGWCSPRPHTAAPAFTFAFAVVKHVGIDTRCWKDPLHSRPF